jgi:hypothetical protein
MEEAATVNPLTLSLPVDDDCDDCAAVTPYVKYNHPSGTVALPSTQGLPNNILFTCTLCNTNFENQRALERHMKNQHEAFNQKVKGSKCKLVVPNANNDDAKKSKITDTFLRDKAVVPYKKYPQ